MKPLLVDSDDDETPDLHEHQSPNDIANTPTAILLTVVMPYALASIIPVRSLQSEMDFALVVTMQKLCNGVMETVKKKEAPNPSIMKTCKHIIHEGINTLLEGNKESHDLVELSAKTGGTKVLWRHQVQCKGSSKRMVQCATKELIQHNETQTKCLPQSIMNKVVTQAYSKGLCYPISMLCLIPARRHAVQVF
jgi:hypothetical protein